MTVLSFLAGVISCLPLAAQGSPPTSPSPYLPAYGTWTTDNTPYFEWENGLNAENHHLLVDNDPDFGSPEVDVEVVGDNKYTVTSELSNGTYYWKVVAVNDYGSSESAVWVFDVLREREPISINGDSGFTPANGVNGGGDGTPGNPFIIRNWVINASSAHGIHVKDTRSYFVIRNCLIENGDGAGDKSGVYLENVENGGVENCLVRGNLYGIYLEGSNHNSLLTNTLENNSGTGILLRYSNNNDLLGNTVENTTFGSGAYNSGIYLLDSDNNTIYNNTVRNNSTEGIELYDSDHNTISNNTLRKNGSYGIRLDSSEYNTISGNTVENTSSSATGYGIGLSSSNHNTFSNNIVKDNPSQGICLSVSDNNTFSNNTVSNNGTEGIELDSSDNNTLSGNRIENNGRQGIKLYKSKSNTFSNNIVRNNLDEGIESSSSSDNNTFSGNVIENNGRQGIDLNQSKSNTFSNNIVRNNGQEGICLYESPGSESKNNILSGNTVENNGSFGGIYLLRSGYSTVSNNTVRSNSGIGYGLYLYTSPNCTISGNTLENNSSHGIYLYYSSDNNKIFNNIVRNNGNNGINVEASSNNNEISYNTVANNSGGIYFGSISYNCIIHHNLIHSNGTNAYDAGTNAWDNGSEGNWWGDWQWENAVDANNDGIFENRRLISGGVYDRYPLSLVNLKSPGNGASASSPVTLQWTAPALPVYLVQMDDDPNFGSINYENTVNVSIGSFDLSRTVGTSASLGEGLWYWRVKARDSGGREVARSPIWGFTIDLSPPSTPSISSSTHSRATPTSSPNPAFSWNAVGGPTPVVYQYKLEGYDADWRSTTGTSASYTNVPDGSYTFKLRAVDLGGASGTAEYAIIIDTTPSSVTLEGITATQTARGWTLETNLSLFTLTGRVEPGSMVTVNGLPVSVQGGSFSATYDLSAGQNRFVIRVVDPAGNVTERTLLVYYSGEAPPTAVTGPSPVSGPNLLSIAAVILIVVLVGVILKFK